MTILPQERYAGDWWIRALASTTAMIFFGLALALIIIGWWRLFTKAGQAGWKSIIPVYNVYILLKIVGRPWWWLLLMLVPMLNIVIWLLVCIDLARSFDKGVFVWGVILLFLLNGIGFIILGWSGATYQGPSAGQSAPA